MKRKYLPLSILFWCMLWIGPSWSQIRLHWTEGAAFEIHQVSLLDDDIRTWKDDPMPLKQLFFRYTYPESIDVYKALFFQSGYPSNIDEVYDDWQEKMKGVKTEAQGIFYGQLDSLDVACIQYAFTQSGYTIQMSFLAYRTNGTWYPVEASRNLLYQSVTGFMAVLQPAAIAAYIHPSTAVDVYPVMQDVLQHCQAADGRITADCVLEQALEWGTSESEDHRKRESQLIKARYERDLPAGNQEEINTELQQYLDQLALPVELLRKIKYHFSKNEVLHAISALQENGIDIRSIDLYNQLNRIQRTSMYRMIDESSLDSLKQK